LVSPFQPVWSAREECGNDKAIGGVDFLVHDHQGPSFWSPANGKEFAFFAREYPLGFRHGLHDLFTQSSQLTMLFDDVRPALIRESNEHTIA
jgi:hypothetical protein